MSKPDFKTDLPQTQALYKLLQGELPEGVSVPLTSVPQLTADQAWTVVWYIGNLKQCVSDTIERCDVCGDLYDSENGGGYDELGPPYHFCDPCGERECLSREQPEKTEGKP